MTLLDILIGSAVVLNVVAILVRHRPHWFYFGEDRFRRPNYVCRSPKDVTELHQLHSRWADTATWATDSGKTGPAAQHLHDVAEQYRAALDRVPQHLRPAAPN